ncbi:MAG: hypothetical protein GX144_10190 [Clostridiaceae bacterium]|jgi:hypothetical protein|nr:hypothetical protein [Clostridiaceae bacterium]
MASRRTWWPYLIIIILVLLISCILTCVLLLSACTQRPSAASNLPSTTDAPKSVGDAQQIPPPAATESLAERLTGVYITSISEIDEWAISIRSIGGLLLIENSLCSDGIVYSFWAQELVPDDASVLDESSSDSI